jgi:hypothetical protein
LPDPVFAMARQSLSVYMIGHAAAYIGVGEGKLALMMALFIYR